MSDPSDKELFDAMLQGEEVAFERIYDRYHQRIRLIAWRVSHRADWVDDILNEAWCRAFRQRQSYNPQYAFTVWMAGILQNIYREHCRKSPLTLHVTAEEDDPHADRLDADERQPEDIASEAELLDGLNDCVSRLSGEDATIIRLRFFKEMTLRTVAKEVGLPESTLRNVRLPAAFEALRGCLKKKGLEIFDLFPAHGPSEMQ